ncbi:MAG: hypothetical protein VB877_19555 [Pirellulaceae bacterium]
MKRNRRQELQTNILADRLGRVINSVRPHLVTILVILGVVIVVVVGTAVVKASRGRKDAALWEAFLDITLEKEQAKTGLFRSAPQAEHYSALAEELDALAEEHADHEKISWVKAAASDARLGAGMRRLYSEKFQAEILLFKAKESYRDLIRLGNLEDKDLDERVRYGYAQACEALASVQADGAQHMENMAEARKMYELLSASSVSSGIRIMAQSRARILKPVSGAAWDPDSESLVAASFSSWLSQQELPVPKEPPPTDGTQFPGGFPMVNPAAGLGLEPAKPIVEPAKEPAKEPVDPKKPAAPKT